MEELNELKNQFRWTILGGSDFYDLMKNHILYTLYMRYRTVAEAHYTARVSWLRSTLATPPLGMFTCDHGMRPKQMPDAEIKSTLKTSEQFSKWK